MRQLTPSTAAGGVELLQDIREENEEDAMSMPLKSSKAAAANQLTFKEHNTKKNAQCEYIKLMFENVFIYVFFSFVFL